MKKILALIAALTLVLLGLVAPSTSAFANGDVCTGYTDKIDGQTGSFSGEFGSISWDGQTVSWNLTEGYVVDLCVKSGAKAGTTRTQISGSDSLTIGQDISHVAYTVVTEREPQPEPCVPEDYNGDAEGCGAPPTEEPCPDDSMVENPETGECEPVEPTEPPTEEPTPTEPPTDHPDTPVTPESPETPNTPDTPDVPEGEQPRGTPSSESYCLGGALVTKSVDANGNSSTSTENGHPDCALSEGEVVKEEGM